MKTQFLNGNNANQNQKSTLFVSHRNVDAICASIEQSVNTSKLELIAA